MNPLNTLLVAFAAVAVTMLFVYISSRNSFCGCSGGSAREGFENGASSGSPIAFASCPPDTKTFTNSKGVVACCKGDANGMYCSGTVFCAISANTDGIPMCSQVLKQQSEQQGKSQCPPSMPNYYQRAVPGGAAKEFCTSGVLNNQINGPMDESKPSCSIGDYMQDVKSVDSCATQRLYDTAMCPNEPCSKSKAALKPNMPVVIQVTYTDKDGMPHSCYADQSLRNYYSAMGKTLEANNINMCSVSKKVYVEHSMQIANTVNT